MVEFNIVVAVELNNEKVTKRCYYKADYEKICSFLSNVEWDVLFNGKDVNDMWLALKGILDEVIDKFVPVKKIARGKRCMWMNYETKKAIRKRNKVWRKYSETKNYFHLLEYKRVRNKAVLLGRHGSISKRNWLFRSRMTQSHSLPTFGQKIKLKIKLVL